jgi:AcrR family transcriptional regulator
MAPIDTSGSRPGLRERKKQQTRDTIARVALQLFAERGYDHTTLAEIAEAADVSPRTIFSYFQSKEDILFSHEAPVHERLKRTLEQRPPGSNTVDALREFIATLQPRDDVDKLREQIIGSNEALRMRKHAHSAPVEELIAASVAKDLDSPPGDIRPALVAASVRAAFTAARERIEAESGSPITHEQAMGIIDEVLEFLRGGLQALQQAQATTRPSSVSTPGQP